MSWFFGHKVVRLLLSISVSVWMAGACLFGCTNGPMATESGESCHAMAQQPEGVASFAPIPRGMMKDCPLIASATAVTAKSSTHVPDPGRVAVAVLPTFEKQIHRTNNSLVVSFLPNRGPTHLRCCVFLI